MKKIVNNIIPFKGFATITLWPFIFIRKDEEKYYTDVVDRHEHIHGEQQKEMLLVFFFLWYCIEWIVRLCIYRNRITAYKNVSFEREAYGNQYDSTYPDNREHYSWIEYL